MIIDFHQHLILPINKIKAIMRKYGIDKVVMMPLNFGKLGWEDIIRSSGMACKSSKFRKNVLDRNLKVNRLIKNLEDNDN